MATFHATIEFSDCSYLPRRAVVVVDDVLVAVGGVEGVILLGAEAEEDVALEHVDAQRVHRRDHRVYPDVELE